MAATENSGPGPASPLSPGDIISRDRTFALETRLEELQCMGIMVIGEVSDDAALIKAILTESGFTQVRIACDEEEALQALRDNISRDPHRIDLVLFSTTVHQPDGYRICQTLRTHELWREIPIIVIRPRSDQQDETLTESFNIGATDIVFQPIQRLELIPRVISALLLKTERDIRQRHEDELEAELAERKVMEARLQYLVSHDDLTGLANRRRLEKMLEAAVTGAQARGKSGALIYIDLDQFKIINELEGHATGDRLLMSVANILRSRLNHKNLLARISSDEYAVLIEDIGEADALSLSESLRKAIDRYCFRTDDRQYQISASIGVLMISPGDAMSASDALARSAQACFEAKAHGRNLVYLFNKNDQEGNTLRNAADWVPRIREALSHDNFRMVFQPVIDLSDDRIVGYEALIRMVDINGGLITPDQFIPIAEHMGLIHDIDLWVVSHAIDTIHHLPEAFADMTLNVNLSIHAFQDPALLSLVRERLAETGVQAKRITFEITETAAVANYNQTRNMVNLLREIGCRFALDDFGTGFSSFNYLKQFPVDYLKIDGSFISNLLNDPIDQRLVKSMIEVGQALDKTIVAEFVENAETLALLKEYGVDRAQGNYIGTPRTQIP